MLKVSLNSNQPSIWLIDRLIDSCEPVLSFVSEIAVHQCSTEQSGHSRSRSMKSWLVPGWYRIICRTQFTKLLILLHSAVMFYRHSYRCHRQLTTMLSRKVFLPCLHFNIFRSNPPSRPNKVGLKCPSVRT